MPASVCLIVNPSAGGGKSARLAPAVLAELQRRGLQARRVDTRDIEDARRLGREAAAAGETVAALSGDGLVGVLADELRSAPGAVLAVLPGGRGNDLARVLGVPEDAVEACATVADGIPRPVDLGIVAPAQQSTGVPSDAAADGSSGAAARPAAGAAAGHAAAGAAAGHAAAGAAAGRAAAGTGSGRAFVGIASAGFDSDANRIANEAPPWLGSLVYAYGALRALLSWRPARFEIELHPSGERHSFSGYTVAAANSRAYGGGMMMAPAAMLDDGLLELIAVEQVGKLRFLANLPRVFKGTHVEVPTVRVFRAAEATISSDRPFTMYADGDPVGELPVRVRALPGAVTILTPAGGSAALS